MTSWYVEQFVLQGLGGFRVIDSEGVEVCELYPKATRRVHVSPDLARLIAAAPELLEALSGLIVGLMVDFPHLAITLNNWKPVVVARAVIAKAEGKA
jgi:predicted nuclease with RNAse H fold